MATITGMDIVLAGAIELTPTDIAIILLLLAAMAYGHLCVLADYLLAPFTLRRTTDGWALAFIPFAAPHMAVHHWGMGTRFHVGLATTAAGSILLGVAAATDTPLRGAGSLSAFLLFAHFHIRLRVADHQRGRQRGVSRLFIVPFAWAVLPWVQIGVIRNACTPAGCGRPAPPRTPPGPQQIDQHTI